MDGETAARRTLEHANLMKIHRVHAAWGILAVANPCAPACQTLESDPCTVTICDISRGACQRDAFEAIACARDHDGSIPPVEVLSYTEFQSRNDAPPFTLREQQMANAFVTLGFAPSIGSLTRESGNPMAYYSRGDGRVTIVESSEDDDIRTFALLQAFANAQQDVDYDLHRLFDEAAASFDASLAMSATVYGEAFFSSAIAWDDSFGTDDSSPRHAIYDMKDVARQHAADPAVAFPSVNAAFALGYGGSLYSRRWSSERDGRSEIASLFSNPPQTTLAVISNDLPGRPPEELTDPELDIEAPHQVVAVDTLGAWMARTFVLRAGGPTMVDEWRGDRFTLVGGETSADIGIHWRIELRRSAADTGQQIREASASRPWFVHTTDETLIIVAAFDASSLSAWVERFGLMPLEDPDAEDPDAEDPE